MARCPAAEYLSRLAAAVGRAVAEEDRLSARLSAHLSPGSRRRRRRGRRSGRRRAITGRFTGGIARRRRRRRRKEILMSASASSSSSSSSASFPAEHQDKVLGQRIGFIFRSEKTEKKKCTCLCGRSAKKRLHQFDIRTTCCAA